MKKSLFICFFLSLFIGAYSQEVELKLTLRDGNIVSGSSKLDKVSLATDYGKLEIPVKNVTSLEIGISPDKANTEKIINLVKQLSNSNEQMRKNAYDELSKSGIRTIPVISEFINSSNFESSTYTDFTAEAVLSDLQAAFNVSDGYSSKDLVSIDYEYSMGGVYDFQKIDLKTEYGTLSVPKEKIKHIDVLYTGGAEKGEMTFKLLGTKHISSNTNGGWLNTGIMVKQGQKLSIRSSGEITFASLSGSKYKPDGSVSGTSAPAGNYEGEYASGNTYPTYGNVVYKIGESGNQLLKAGARFNGIAANSGILFLSVYETVYNASNTGSYTIKISVK